MTRAQSILFTVDEVMSPKLKRGLTWGAVGVGGAAAGVLASKYGDDVMHYFRGIGGGGKDVKVPEKVGGLPRNIPFERSPKGHIRYQDDLHQRYVDGLRDHEISAKNLRDTESIVTNPKVPLPDRIRLSGKLAQDLEKHAELGKTLKQQPYREFGQYDM